MSAGVTHSKKGVSRTWTFLVCAIAICSGVALLSGCSGEGYRAESAPAENKSDGQGPKITSISPNHGGLIGGDEVVITGSNFVKDGTTVYFGEEDVDHKSEEVEFVSTTEIKVTTPAGDSSGSVDVVVVTDLGTYRLKKGFSYDCDEDDENCDVGDDDDNDDDDDDDDDECLDSETCPTIDTISPSEGKYNEKTEFTITGQNLKGDKTLVYIGKKKAQKCEVEEDGTAISCKTPKSRTAKEFDVKVVVRTGKVKQRVIQEGGFTYTDDQEAKAPTIASLSPTEGKFNEETEFTITGTNFKMKDGKTLVYLGSKRAKECAVTEDETAIACKTPKSKWSGEVQVKVVVKGKGIDREAISEEAFIYTYSGKHEAPSILSVTPSSGYYDEKTEIVIEGSHFRKKKGTTNYTKVYIGSEKAKGCKVNDDETQVTCKTPKSKVLGLHDVKVVIKYDDISFKEIYSDGFRYVDHGVEAEESEEEVDQPSLSSIEPNSGTKKGGTEIVIWGENLSEYKKIKVGKKKALDCEYAPGASGGMDSITCLTPKANKKGLVDVSVFVPKTVKNGKIVYKRLRLKGDQGFTYTK